MAAVVLIGAQWGDEGKGKITDFLAEKASMIIRSSGGNNAAIRLLWTVRNSNFI